MNNIHSLKRLTLRDKLASGLFWSWNLIFLAFMVLGFAPRMLPEVLNAVRSGLVPLNFLVYAIVLSLVPLAAVALGLTALRREPQRLFALGYVVEGPLMLVLVIRFFLIRQATSALTFVLVVALLGMVAFTWHLLDPQLARSKRWKAYLRLFGLTLMLLTSLYAAVWIAFYALPLVTTALRWVVENLLAPLDFVRGVSRSFLELIAGGWAWVPFVVLGFFLLLYTATLFVVAPVAVPLLSVRAWSGEFSALVKSRGWLRPVVVPSITTALAILIFVVTNQQPQKQVFAQLDHPPGSMEDARELLKSEKAIRAGLLNAYLAPFRYISAVGEVRHIRDIYEQVFHLTEQRAYGVQQLYEGVARPLLYDPVQRQEFPDLKDNWALQREPQQAARRYQQFFDTPIAEGERQQIVRAVRSTWSADQAESAWQAVDDREVLLVRQEVNVAEHGDWAEIELYEIYENQTAENQEVIYYFNLPESSVITGVWLGNGPERDERFAYRVTPRGAAQTVYREETRVNRDPALLEQIGPRQYRLRVFPVPPIGMRWDEDLNRSVISYAPQLHMWLTYRTFSEDNAWPLPRLAEWRNIYWDGDSTRLVNGETLDIEVETWLPESIPAASPVAPLGHRLDFPGGESVLAVPVSPAELPDLPQNLGLAVVLDRSYSMADYSQQVTSALARLEDLRMAGATMDVYLTASRFRGEPPVMVSLVEVELGELFYFGGQNAAELLAQFAELSEGRAYDAVLVLTDGSGYELGESQVDVPIPEAPVWMVHLGGDIPLGYDDRTLEAIQVSGGGVAADIDQALTRLAVSLSGEQQALPAGAQDVLDGYMWTVLPTQDADAYLEGINVQTGDDGFGALAARRLILAEMFRQRGSIDQLETLDQLHALAKEYGIVTPYSSMIVLVNERQEAALERLEQQTDRFNREYEAVGETIPPTEMPLSGVPEPEEWLLLSLAVAMLAWYTYRRRLAHQPG